MEKVWGELKKIDSKAEQIRTEAQQSSNAITSLAQKQAEKLLGDSQKYAEAEAQQIFDNAVSEANRSREEQLKTNVKVMEKLVEQSDERTEKASETIFNAILGET